MQFRHLSCFYFYQAAEMSSVELARLVQLSMIHMNFRTQELHIYIYIYQRIVKKWIVYHTDSDRISA